MTELLEIRGLAKRFDDRLVLGPLHFAFETGETVAVIGRSGCGKSTLLRLIAGLDEPSAGTATLGGRPIRPEDVAVVFQEPRLMPWLSVADNVGFGLSHLAKAKRAEAIAEALAVVGLADAAAKLPKQLSGGMAQRVALARALVVRPRLLLLDEPFSALDPLTRTGLQNHLGEVRDHYGPTILLITHDMDEALALADRIIVLDGPPGRIVAEFAPRLAPGIKRTAPQFQRWKDRLTDVLGLDTLGPVDAPAHNKITKLEEHRHAV
ncbi:nitrate/sulfonate/bicarbonate ABC transporter ATP-binding protein [Aliidongia dinghuensis]|uniref:Nitrate/sulfonate/bicarbonate ABC transporter ATP-binding protein n=1 Tax=Aliidongia dinghuensis TaxID=1867774 RepID=A0A8J2Z1V2_9PROT|nr:ABC transporter ATP-binding protein [Aliidongia dinghuensis]GGF49971.1 nitrate/sulfonate/bicarbonate ABC transporter ATP-binding protein [Aliidongia dinghuensis]